MFNRTFLISAWLALSCSRGAWF